MLERFKLYNPERKKEYALSIDGAERTIITNLTAFAKIKRNEELFEKDLCDFSIEEIKDMMMSLGASSESAIARYVSLYKDYINWCIVNKKTKDIDVPINNMEFFQKTCNFSDYVPNMKLKNKHLSKNEFKNLIDILVNPIDALLLLMPYNFILGEDNHEIVNVKYKDIDFDNKKILIHNSDGSTRVQPVDSLFLEYAKDSWETKEYILNNGEPDSRGYISHRKLVESDYLIKPIRRGDNQNQIAKNNFPNFRLYNIKQYTGYGEITYTSIRNIRIMHMVDEILDKNTLDEDVIQEAFKKVFKYIEEIYNISFSVIQQYSIKSAYLQLRKIK